MGREGHRGRKDGEGKKGSGPEKRIVELHPARILCIHMHSSVCVGERGGRSWLPPHGDPGNAVNTEAKADSCSFECVKCVSARVPALWWSSG